MEMFKTPYLKMDLFAAKSLTSFVFSLPTPLLLGEGVLFSVFGIYFQGGLASGFSPLYLAATGYRN
jgi:hypothetical protein